MDLNLKKNGKTNMTGDELRYKKQRIYEILSAYFVIAGGIKFSEEQLSQFTFEHILDMAYSNGITLQFGTEERITKY